MSADRNEFEESDAERLTGATVERVEIDQHPSTFERRVTLHFKDRPSFSFSPWDYEGYSAGLYVRWGDEKE